MFEISSTNGTGNIYNVTIQANNTKGKSAIAYEIVFFQGELCKV